MSDGQKRTSILERPSKCNTIVNVDRSYGISNLLSNNGGAEYHIHRLVTKIRDYFLYGDSHIKSVTSNNVTSIGNRAFMHSKIETLTINMLSYIGVEAFKNCENLQSIDSYTEVSVDSRAFASCYSLKNLGLRLKKIGENSFANSGIEIAKLDPNCVMDIPKEAFFNCSNLTNIYYSNTVRTVGRSAFNGCSSLEYFNSNATTSVSEYSFNYCTNMYSLNIPNVKEIKERAFYYCSKLTHLNIPMVDSIGDYAFYHNMCIETVDLQNVSYIGTQAFGECKSLKKFIIRSPLVCVAGSFVFFDTYANTDFYIYVPKALIEDYKVAKNWSQYDTLFRAIEDYPEICGGD